MAPIIEAGKDDDGKIDPWTAKENERKERVGKQKNREKRNIEEIYGRCQKPFSLVLVPSTQVP